MKIKIFLVAIMMSVLGNLIFPQSANASKTYNLKLTVIEKNTEGKQGIYDGDGDLLDRRNGIKVCSDSKRIVDVSDSGILYSKINLGTKVRIIDGSGKLLTIASLRKVDWIQTGTPRYSFTDREKGVEVNTVDGTCTFSQSIKLPKSSFYSFQLSGVDGSFPTFDYSAKDLSKMKWKLTLRF